MSLTGDDCYFYYYSNCTKGDGCPFRHGPQALGSETVCTLWRQGHCYRSDCRFRHMEIQKDRSGIPCYWETQPGGCTKPHCVFKHFKHNNPVTELYVKNVEQEVVKGGETVTPGQRLPSESLENVSTPQVEPVVVNPFDEESDAENSAAGSPAKRLVKKVAESKAVRIPPSQPSNITLAVQKRKDSDMQFSVKSLDEIRREKLQRAKKDLAEADDLLASTVDKDELPVHSLDELVEDLDDADNLRQVQMADSTSGLSRRIIVVDEEKPLSPRKASQNVLSRLGLPVAESNTSSRDSATRRTGTTSSIHSRLGITRTVQAEQSRTDGDDDGDDDDDDVDAPPRRRGLSSGVLSRLGHGIEAKPAEKGPAGRPVQSGIKSRLGIARNVASESDETDSLGKPSDVGRRKGILDRLGMSSNVVKSGESKGASSETENRSGILGRLGINPPNLQRDGRKHSVTDKDKSDRGRKLKSSNEVNFERDGKVAASRSSKVTVLSKVTLPSSDSKRTAREERKIYRPPPAKAVDSVDARQRIRRSEKMPEFEQKAGSKKKTPGWGVKTFSEIMQEKRMQRQQEQHKVASDGGDSDELDGVSTRVHQSGVSPRKRNKSFTKITFKENKTNSEPAEKKSRKFEPIVFDVDNGDKRGMSRGGERSARSSVRSEEASTTVRSREKASKRPLAQHDLDMFECDTSTAESQADGERNESSIQEELNTNQSRRATSPVQVTSSTDDFETQHSTKKKSRLEAPSAQAEVTSPTDKFKKSMRSPRGVSGQTSRQHSVLNESHKSTPGRLSRESSGDHAHKRVSRRSTEDSFLDDELETLLGDVNEAEPNQDVTEDDLLLEMEELLA